MTTPERWAADAANAISEILGGLYLIGTTWLIVVYHVLFGSLSLIAAACGAYVGLHGVWRLLGYPKCRLCLKLWPMKLKDL